MEPVHRVLALGAQVVVHPLADLRLGGHERLGAGVQRRLAEQRRQVVADRHRQDEVAVGEPLHQRGGAEPVGAVVGEVRLADRVQPGDGRHQVVVDPQAAHRVVRSGVDAHRHLVRVLARDPLVHLEQVPVAGADDVHPEPVDRVREVEVDAVAARADAAVLVDHALRRARCHVTRDEVAERGIAALEEVVALVLGDLVRRAIVTHRHRHPDAPVVAQRLAHQRQLGLRVVGLRDARGVDLREARVRERGAALVRAPDRGGVATPWRWCSRRTRSSTRRWRARPRARSATDLAGQQVARHDPARGCRRRRRRRASPCACAA